MKILMVGFNLSGAMGDGFKYFMNVLPKYDENNEWYSITLEKFDEEIENVSIKKISYRKSVFSLLRNLNILSNYIKKENFDRILVLTPNFLFNIFIGLTCKCPMYYFLHDPTPHEGEKFIRRNILKIQNFIMCDNAEKIVVASNNLINAVHSKKFRAKTVAIQLGLLENLCFKEIHNADGEKETDILFFGRVEKYKGLDVLEKALHILNSKGMSIKCKIIGKGNIDECIQNRSLFEICNEYISDFDLASEISRSKIVVLPYKMATGTQTIQVAYYYGCSVVVSDTGCFVDYVLNGQTGYIFKSMDETDLAQKLQMLLNNSKYISMKVNIENFLSDYFSEKHIAESYYDLMKK